MEIGTALSLMRSGLRVRRAGWKDPSTYIALQMPENNSKMGLPYIYIKTCKGKLCPWTISNQDLLSTDWEEFNA